MIPAGAHVLTNRHGTAPAIFLEDSRGRWVAMLPGVPREMRGIFNEELRGPGVQHLASTVKDIIGCVRLLRERGLAFMPTPGPYYDALPARGDGPGKYLLQIFLKESSGLYKEEAAGPFFFEIIQRKGDEGFGAGNFRALFESIERAQQAPAR